jgi:hypothetical protein
VRVLQAEIRIVADALARMRLIGTDLEVHSPTAVIVFHHEVSAANDTIGTGNLSCPAAASSRAHAMTSLRTAVDG